MIHTKLEFVESTPPFSEGVDQRYLIEKVVIAEHGMESGLPLVVFYATDGKNNHEFMLTGRTLTAISAAVKGCNMRNFGVEEP